MITINGNIFTFSELSGHISLQKLDLNNFNIPELMAGHLEHLNETNLQVLELDGSSIKNISSEAFRGMLLDISEVDDKLPKYLYQIFTDDRFNRF